MANRAFKISPKNYLADWGEFEDWSLGTGSAPTGWIAATAPTCFQEATIKKYGDFGLGLVGGSGVTVSGVYQTVPGGNGLNGQTFKFGIWARSTSTGPYVELNDGVASQTVHLDGNDAMYFLTTPAMKLDYAATQLRVNLWATIGSTVYFDSGILCEGEDLFTDLGDGNILLDTWSPSLSLKADQYEISQREFSVIPETHLKSRDIIAGGTIAGTDVISTRTHFDSLMKAVLSWKKTEERNIYLYDDRVKEVFLKDFNYNYVNSLNLIKYTMKLTAKDSTTRFNNKYRSRTIISGTITEFNLVYNGSSESKPVISFIANQGGAITTCQLENLTTREQAIYTGTVPSGVALDIDCDSGTIVNSSINAIADFGTSDFIRIVRGTNYFRFTGSNCQINIDWFDRYL